MVKKAKSLCIVFIMMITSAFLFSQEKEEGSGKSYDSWSMLAPYYQVQLDFTGNSGTYAAGTTHQIGLMASSYSFLEDKNWGLAYSFSVSIPFHFSSSESVPDNSDFFGINFEIYGGLAGKVPLGDSINLYGSFGPTIQFLNYFEKGANVANAISGLSLGLQADLGINIELTDSLSLVFGTKASFDFLYAGEVMTNSSYTNSMDYYGVRIAPYIGISFNGLYKRGKK